MKKLINKLLHKFGYVQLSKISSYISEFPFEIKELKLQFKISDYELLAASFPYIYVAQEKERRLREFFNKVIVPYIEFRMIKNYVYSGDTYEYRLFIIKEKSTEVKENISYEEAKKEIKTP